MSRARVGGVAALVITVGFTVALAASTGVNPAGRRTSAFPSGETATDRIRDTREGTTLRAWAGGGGGRQGDPTLGLEYSTINFGVTGGGAKKTGPQEILVFLASGSWTATSVTAGCGFVTVAGGAGAGNGSFTVSLENTAYSPGAFLCQIEVTAPGALNSPQYLDVNVTVHGATSAPFGSFATPLNNSTGVFGSIVVSGWALDDIQVETVKIWRDRVPTEPPGSKIFIGDADLVEGARPDIVTKFPNHPLNYEAGWGYLLLTNMLPNQGNGTFVLYAFVTDKEGNTSSLGARTIVCDNASAINPFGAIGTPGQGGTATGTVFWNHGWALTGLQSMIPTDGSTITVFIDGVPVGHPDYDNFRPDIAALFPGYANSDGAGASYPIDTTLMTNGVHTLAWSVRDASNNVSGIGSRFFNVLNLSAGLSPPADNVPDQLLNQPVQMLAETPDPVPFVVRTGFDLEQPFRTLEADSATVEIPELGRLELDLDRGGRVKAFLVVDGRLARLPLGATFDHARGRFYWQPGPGFLGEYRLAFVRDGEGHSELTSLNVVVAPQRFDRISDEERLAQSAMVD